MVPAASADIQLGHHGNQQIMSRKSGQHLLLPFYHEEEKHAFIFSTWAALTPWLESSGKQAPRGKTGNGEVGLRKLILLQSLGWKMAAARNKCTGQNDTKGVGQAANTERNAGLVMRKVDYTHEKNDRNVFL